MKTLSTTPAWLLYLLAPMMALAQVGPTDSERADRLVATSPALWYWVAMLVVAAVAFAVVTFRMSKRRQPPHRPSTP